MMANIFNIFDPSSSPKLSLNWMSILIVLMLMPYPYWTFHSRFSNMWSLFLHLIFTEFKVMINYSYSNIIMFASLMIMILFNNLMGLFPYTFTATSHISFCLSLSLSMWIAMMTYLLLNYFNNLCSHLTPQGTPMLLMPFMVIIESISLIIRPVTLAIRLTANMIAGHLLLSLLGSSGMKMPMILLPFLMLAQILLLSLELSVALIQSYVFSVLTTLYSSEA